MAASEGSKELNHKELNHKVGSISHYTRNSDRAMIKLEGRQDLVKVKRKRAELPELDLAGGGSGVRSRSRDSARSTSRNARNGGARGGARSRPNGSSHMEHEFNLSAPPVTSLGTASAGGMRRAASVADFRSADGGSRNSARSTRHTERELSRGTATNLGTVPAGGVRRVASVADFRNAGGGSRNSARSMRHTERYLRSMRHLERELGRGTVAGRSTVSAGGVRRAASVADFRNADGGSCNNVPSMKHMERELSRSTVTGRSTVSTLRDTDSLSQSLSSDHSHDILETLRSADAMFELADTSGDGVISQEEYETYMRKYTDHDAWNIRESFFGIDVDGNGNITRDEVRSAFLKKEREARGGGAEATAVEKDLLEVSRDADALFEKADVNKDNELSAAEFLLYMKKNTDHSEAAIHELFEQFDTDKDGSITRIEVRKALHELSKGEEGKKLTLAELLYLDDDEVAELEGDVYNILFLSDKCSAPFWFAIIVWVLKLLLINIIAVDLYTVREFPARSDVSLLVKMAQFLLIPVNVAVQEELIATYYVCANLEWSEKILELHPGATRGKYRLANFLRFVDGLCFLFINTTLLLQADDVVGAFLNFAALQFLSTIDNVALCMARDGYLNDSLEEVAKDVKLQSLPKNHSNALQVLDSVMLAVTYLICLVAWVLFMFTDMSLG